MLNNRLLALLGGCVLAATSISAQARPDIDFNLGIITAPPAPAVVAAPPGGYANCYMTRGMWSGNIWIPAHQECSYPGPSGMSIWASGYWGCVVIGPHGRCGHWRWYSPRWVRGHYYDHEYRHGYDHHRYHDRDYDDRGYRPRW